MDNRSNNNSNFQQLTIGGDNLPMQQVLNAFYSNDVSLLEK